MKLRFSILKFVTPAYILCLLSRKKELNYDRFVDPNVLGASRLVHSSLRNYRISFFLLDLALFRQLFQLFFYSNRLLPGETYWLGFTQRFPVTASSGNLEERRSGWRWLETPSSESGYTNWAATEPSQGDLCMILDSLDGLWYGEDCQQTKHRPICKRVSLKACTKTLYQLSSNIL